MAQPNGGYVGRDESASATPASQQSVGDTLVVTANGANKPGVTWAFLDVVKRAEAPVRVLDVAQYVVEGALVLSIMLQFLDTSSMSMMKDLLDTSKRLGMQLHFNFPTGRKDMDRQVSFDETHQVSISIVLPDTLPGGLLQSVFRYLGDRGGRILQVEHRLDNKIGWNGEYTKLCMHAALSAAVPISRLYLDLQKLCWKHSAEVAVREWDAMNRPNGKSLVVFGLSDVLCPYDVLDELLKEAGVDPALAETSEYRTPEAKVAAKARLLQGKPASCQQRLVERLRYTEGARLVCSALKEIGFRLALLTMSGGKAVAQAVKQELGLDYAIAPSFEVDSNGLLTGRHTDATDDLDMQLRKADYLQLVAAREGIDPRNVIVVGSFMKGLAKASAYEILDTYGPTLYFHAPKNRSLVILLYLLGLSGMEVQALRQLSGAEASPAAPLAPAVGGTGDYRLVRVHSNDSAVATFAKLFDPLVTSQEAGELSILSMQAISMASGDTFMGLELALGGADPQKPLKDLLYESHILGMDMTWDKREGVFCTTPGDGDGGFSRWVLTVVRRPALSVTSLAAVFHDCSDLGVDCMRLERLCDLCSELSALQISALVPNGVEAELRDRLLAVSKSHDVDIAFQRDGMERWSRRLIVFDMDSTLIQQEVIDELAKMAGVEATVSEITERAMRGELDFHQSLRERVALLKGHNAEKLFNAVKANLVYTPGAHELCATLKRLGYKMAVISGGFLPVAREVQRSLGLDYAFANTLQVDTSTGLLTGLTVGPVVTPQRKKALLSMIAEVEGCDLRQTVAVGDGSNDIPMLKAAGLGIAFCAKPKVQAAAEFRVNNKDLSTVLFLLGLSEVAATRLQIPSSPSLPTALPGKPAPVCFQMPPAAA